MKLEFLPQAEADILQPFRYYAVEQDVPVVGTRFRDAVKITAKRLAEHPGLGVAFPSSIPGLRSWPVTGFPMIRMYYLQTAASLRIVRILHGKRDIRRALSQT